jgi:hypothetical protein
MLFRQKPCLSQVIAMRHTYFHGPGSVPLVRRECKELHIHVMSQTYMISCGNNI